MSNTDFTNHTTTMDPEQDYPYTAPCESTTEDLGKILPIFYSLVFILGLIGNGLVMCVFAKHCSKINVTDICLLNLTISDLFFVLSMPFYAHTALVGNWIFGAFMCHLINGLYNMGFYGGIFSVIAMTLDRYVVIMHAHTLARYRGFRSGVAVTMLVWVLSFSISMPMVAIVGLQNDSIALQCYSFPESGAGRDFHLLSSIIIGLLIPLLVMVICYSQILPALMAMRSAKRHRAVRLVIVIMVVFFLFWTPYNLSLFLLFLTLKTENLSNTCETIDKLYFSIQVTEVIAYTHCCLNPIIYAFVGQKFARRARGLVHAWLPCVFRRVPRDGSSRKYSVSVSMSSQSSAFAM